jgi:hypothetical protein
MIAEPPLQFLVTWADHVPLDYGTRSTLECLTEDYKLRRAQKLALMYPFAVRRPVQTPEPPLYAEVAEFYIAIAICDRQYWAFKIEADRDAFLSAYPEGEIFPAGNS